MSDSKGTVRGSCLCGSVTFEATPPFAEARYCHCSRCRKATAAAHAANSFVPQNQFKWLSGEDMIKRFDLPGAKRFAVWFCSHCGTRVPHKIKTTDNMLLLLGLLDTKLDMQPEKNIFWDSKAEWYVSPDSLPKHSEYGPA